MKVFRATKKKQHVIGWTKAGAVIWLYWTASHELICRRMSPRRARYHARTAGNLDIESREQMNDCSYSAERYGPIDAKLDEKSVINPTENPQVRTIGLSLSWWELSES